MTLLARPMLVSRVTARLAGGLVVVMAVALLGCSGGTGGSPAQADAPAPAELLPEDFPVPADARVVQAPGGVGGRGVVTLGAPGSSDEILAFYERELPPLDWELDPWEGTDPFGKPTSGFIMERGEETAALSITDEDDGEVLVQLNFHQPSQPAPGEAHGGHGGAPPTAPASEDGHG